MLREGDDSSDTDTRNESCPAGGAPPNGPPRDENDGLARAGVDDDYDGCIDNDTQLGEGQCTCIGKCGVPSCNNRPKATCNPYKPNVPESCGDGVDNNCDGRSDEGCAFGGGGGGGKSCQGPDCKCSSGGATAGADPIFLSSRSAVTEPFVDFSIDTGWSQLDMTRTYSSNDSAYTGSPAGVFGRGWHHDWEAWLSCSGSKCTVVRGILSGYEFKPSGTALSLDGSEIWQVFVPWSNELLKDDHQNILVRRPTGEWIVFLTDGRELHFDTVCDACIDPAGDAFCYDAAAGGKARLVKTVDVTGNAVQLSYNRPGGILLALSDDLGHNLQLMSTSACGNGLASSLQYDGTTVANYSYSGTDLVLATDGDGSTLRSYAYDTDGTGRLLAIRNQADEMLASFSYDAAIRAIGIIDRSSSVMVDYDAPGGIQVTEYFGNTSSTGIRTFDQDGHATSISDGCACGPAKVMQWKNRRLVCSGDTLGHVTWQDYDAQGRSTHQVEYRSSAGCPATLPTSLPTDRREEWYEYGLTRPIAQGVNLSLDMVTTVSRMSPTKNAKYVSETLSYDPASQSIDPTGYTCQQSPLPVGSVLCRRIEGGYTYNASSSIVFERHATFNSYDARGRLVRTLGPINLDYPSASDVTPIEERTYWPDSESLARRGRLKELKRYASPTGTPLVTSYDYDAFGPYQITQPSGAATTIVKDGRGRPILVVGPDSQARQSRYHDGLEPRLQILPSGAAIRYGYDGLGRLAGVEYLSGDPEVPGATPTLGWGEYYIYDAAGNRIHTERRDAAGTVTWQQDREYDVQHRLVRETNPENPATARTNVFDASGFLATSADEEGRATEYTSDGINRVKKVRRSGVDAQGAPVGLDVAQYVYKYYGGDISQVLDGKNQTTSYSYDDFGRTIQLNTSNLKGGQLRFAYDARGNLLQRKDNYVTTSYTYDGFDRVLTVNASDTQGSSSLSYTYRYDETGGVGQLTSVIEPDRTVRYGHDSAGRINSEAIQENGVSVALITSYTYDVDGALWQLTYPSGLVVELVRDPASREVVQMKNVTDGTSYASQVTHLPAGPVKSLVFGNGSTLTQTFNRRYEPQTISSGPLALGYGMTPAGDVATINDGTTARAFSYEFLDRLFSSPGWLDYTYDSVGNRTGETVEAAAATYTYTYDRIKEKWAGSKRLFAYAYDYQTNLSAIGQYDAAGSKITQAACFRHDPLGRLTLFGWADGRGVAPDYTFCVKDSQVLWPNARFKYDARNRRIARQDVTSGQWTYIVSDAAGNPLSELTFVNGSWATVRDYVWLDGKPLAQIEYPGPAGSTQGYVNYFHVDHIGLPRALTNANQQTIWSATARPYGDIVENTTTDPLSGRTIVTNLRLPGQYDERLLSSLGLQGPYYNWNRWYLPSIGRYLELDPLALEGGRGRNNTPDWYNYVEGNPLRRVDPKGLYSEVCQRPVMGPLGALGATHCYLRIGGQSGETVSYWATRARDYQPRTTGDLNPGAGDECHPIDPPGGGGSCDDNRTPFDLCLAMQMVQCSSCVYDIGSFNCCDCVAMAIQECGGTYNGPWPYNGGFGPSTRTGYPERY